MIPMSKMAEILGWTPNATTRFFRRHGLAIMLGRRRFTTMRVLRDKAPDLADAVAEHLAAGGLVGL